MFINRVYDMQNRLNPNLLGGHERTTDQGGKKRKKTNWAGMRMRTLSVCIPPSLLGN